MAKPEPAFGVLLLMKLQSEMSNRFLTLILFFFWYEVNGYYIFYLKYICARMCIFVSESLRLNFLYRHY